MDEYSKDVLDDSKWVDEFQNQDGDLEKTANSLLGSIDDPKLINSEVAALKQITNVKNQRYLIIENPTPRRICIFGN